MCTSNIICLYAHLSISFCMNIVRFSLSSKVTFKPICWARVLIKSISSPLTRPVATSMPMYGSCCMHDMRKEWILPSLRTAGGRNESFNSLSSGHMTLARISFISPWIGCSTTSTHKHGNVTRIVKTQLCLDIR